MEDDNKGPPVWLAVFMLLIIGGLAVPFVAGIRQISEWWPG